MTINLEKAEQAAKWGRAGFGLALAVLSLISLAAEARDSKPAAE